jgi:hypothetical protein
MGVWMYRYSFSWSRHSLRWVVSFTARPLYPRGKSPRYPLDRILGGPQSRSRRRKEEKILGRSGTRTPTPRSFRPQPGAIPTTLLLDSFFRHPVKFIAQNHPNIRHCKPNLCIWQRVTNTRKVELFHSYSLYYVNAQHHQKLQIQETCPSATLSTGNRTWHDLGSKSGRRS